MTPPLKMKMLKGLLLVVSNVQYGLQSIIVTLFFSDFSPTVIFQKAITAASGVLLSSANSPTTRNSVILAALELLTGLARLQFDAFSERSLLYLSPMYYWLYSKATLLIYNVMFALSCNASFFQVTMNVEKLFRVCVTSLSLKPSRNLTCRPSSFIPPLWLPFKHCQCGYWSILTCQLMRQCCAVLCVSYRCIEQGCLRAILRVAEFGVSGSFSLVRLMPVSLNYSSEFYCNYRKTMVLLSIKVCSLNPFVLK